MADIGKISSITWIQMEHSNLIKELKGNAGVECCGLSQSIVMRVRILLCTHCAHFKITMTMSIRFENKWSYRKKLNHTKQYQSFKRKKAAAATTTTAKYEMAMILKYLYRNINLFLSSHNSSFFHSLAMSVPSSFSTFCSCFFLVHSLSICIFRFVNKQLSQPI